MIYVFEVFNQEGSKICEVLTSEVNEELAFSKAKIKSNCSFSVKYKGIKVLQRI